MNARRLILAALCACLAAPLCAQGFAGLGAEARDFAMPERGRALNFPADHGPHPNFRIEWWYLTATLTGEDGRDYGAQWTLFRSALAPGAAAAAGWESPQIWIGHAAVTSADSHLAAERLARGGIGQAGVTAAPFDAWIDDWRMAGAPGAGLSRLTVSARAERFAYRLEMQAQEPLVLHGKAGYSVKSRDGQASHYYSQPSYKVTGRLDLPSGPVEVRGAAWLDREWSSQPLSADQSGWDWLSLSFESGTRLMGFRLRGERGDFTSATWIDAEGRARALPDGALRMTPLEHAAVAGRDIPIRWRVELPDEGLDIEIAALNPQSWMDISVPYWEGPVRASGSHAGRGYLEMTGYN